MYTPSDTRAHSSLTLERTTSRLVPPFLPNTHRHTATSVRRIDETGGVIYIGDSDVISFRLVFAAILWVNL